MQMPNKLCIHEQIASIFPYDLEGSFQDVCSNLLVKMKELSEKYDDLTIHPQIDNEECSYEFPIYGTRMETDRELKRRVIEESKRRKTIASCRTIATCGHALTKKEGQGKVVTIMGIDEGEKCLDHLTVCNKCYQKYKSAKLILTQKQVRKFLTKI